MFRSKLILVSGFFLAALVSQSAHALQYARPDADLTTAGWTAVPSGSLFATVDEATRSDSDYINSGNGNNSTVILRLSDVIDPGVDTGHVLRFTCRATVGGKPKGGEGCNGALYQGGTQISTTLNNTATRGAFGLVTLSITNVEAATISDYTALEVRITSSSLDVDESIQVSWVELEVPDPSATPPTVTNPTFANVTHNSATLGGTMSNDNGTAVTDCGVEWGTSPGGPYPSSQSYDAGTCTSNGGVFTANVTGLPSDTAVYFRAWATNGVAGYSSEATFTTDPAPTVPTVTADPATNIGQNSATLGGEVTSDGGAPPVTARGIVWNTTSPAETGGTSVPMGSGLGTFSQAVSGLPAGTLIYFKAYAVNSVGTGYSAEDSFTTLAGLPTVTSPTKADITATSATLGGTMTSDGGEAPSECGVKWSTTSGTGDTYPEANKVPLGAPCSEGVPFSTPVTGLPTGALVYYRAYATNSAGTAYSAQDSFTPAGPPVVTTTPVTVFGSESADMGGNVTSDGGSTVTARGVVWDTVSPPEAGGTFVPIGSGTGPFSQTVTGLPASTLIYVKAYATNSAGTSYGGQESFTTLNLPEPTVQASNVVFSRISGRAFTIDWTRGNGEGSIVVLRLQATAKTDPQDGNDYTGNPDFGAAPELPASSQNFVIYKGSGNSVWVTGLALDTPYSVAVYEYSNSGTSTDYLLTTPAEGTQATGTVPTHNEDFRVNCNDCHYHGTFGARDVDLKAVCESCHNPSGVASAKLEFDNHLAPNKNPSVDFVDCGVCHELHLGGTTHTVGTNPVTSQTATNKSFVRANVDKYISTSAPPAFLHNDDPGHADPPNLANTPDRAIEGGTDTTARGYCQVCHTQTNYHTNNPSISGSDQCHDGNTGNCGPAETNCGACHEHNNRFIGVGGSVTCVQCHDSVQGIRPIITTQFDRLSSHIPGGSAAATQEDCLVCHNQGGHQSGTIAVWDADDGATSYSQPTADASTLATGEGEAFAPHCMSCHDDGVASSLPASGADQTQTSPFTGSGAAPVIDPGAWSAASHNRPVATSGSSPVTCVGDGVNGCHGSGHGSEQNSLLAPAAGPATSATAFCYTCHDGSPAVDVQSQFAGASINATSASGALVNQRHDITAADQAYSGGVVSCKDCHSVHVDNASNPVADPDSALPLATYSPNNSYTDDGHNFSYNSGGNLDPINPQGSAGGFSEPDYIQFCLTCHDGTAPPGVTPSPGLVNMATAYDGTDQHGAGDGSTGSRTGKGGLKFPFVTSADDAADNDPTAPYAAMNCNICHGAHGTGNIFNLRESITVAGQVLTVGGAPGFLDEPAYAGSTTYTLPLIGGQQTDHYWGAWCTFCHKGDAHPGKVEADACTGGHMHGGGAF